MAHLLYFGDSSPSSTSEHRARALERLGHTVALHDPDEVLTGSLWSRYTNVVHYRTGYRFVQARLGRWVQELLRQLPTPPDAVWVNSGELLGAPVLKLLRELGCPLILYNNDDPTGGRDGQRFGSLLKALSYYDLCAVMREANVAEYLALGAKRVLRVHMSYDEKVHQPFAHAADIPSAYRSEVVFIGTWMPKEKRDDFLLELVQRGVPLTIWGSRWAKSPHWPALRAVHRGDALSGRDYVAAMQGAKISLGLLSKGNRDLHTQRSLEVPYAGGLLCAERTTEHQAMYREGVEAVFWSDAAECARQCQALLQDEARREQIRAAGQQRVQQLQTGNEAVCRQILEGVGIYS